MGQSASQSAIFYKEVEISKKVWTIKDSGGYPAPKNSGGIRSMPFWSSESKAKLIVENVEAYKDFEPIEINFKEFSNLLESIKKDKQLVGLNWSGKNAIGYDLEPEVLINWANTLKPKISFLKNLFK